MTLTLHLKKEWFDKIKSGKKKVEYRECKDYWNKRLNKPFDKIIFKNGYDENSPSLIADFVGLSVVDGIDTDLKIEKLVYAIQFCNVR